MSIPKIFETLKAQFLNYLSKNKSTSKPTINHSNNNTIITQTHNNGLSQAAGGSITNNFNDNRDVQANAKAWDDLLYIFTKEVAARTLSSLSNPQHKNLLPSEIIFVTKKFEKVSILPHDHYANEFKALKKQSLNLIEANDKVNFVAEWVALGEKLTQLKEGQP